MRQILVVLAVAAMVAPAFGVADYFQVTSDGSFNLYKGGSLGGYGNVGAGGGNRMGKTNQHMGFMGFTGATGDTSGLSLDAFVQANGGWSNPNLQVKLHFRATDASLPAVGATAQPAYNGNGGAAVQIGMYLESIRVGLGAGAGGLVEDQATGAGNEYGYKPGITVPGDLGPAAGFQGASEPVAFRGAQPYQTNDRFFNFGEGIAAGPLGTAAGTAWYTPSGYTKGDFTANAPIQWMTGTMPRGFNSSKGGFAVEWLLGGFGNNGGACSGALDATGVPGTNNWAQSGQILAKNPDGSAYVLTAAAYDSSADPRKGTVSAQNVTIPLDMAFAMDLATNPEFRGLAITNNFSTLGAFWGNTGFYTKEQSGQLIPYIEVITPEPATMILLAVSGLALLRRRNA